MIIRFCFIACLCAPGLLRAEEQSWPWQPFSPVQRPPLPSAVDGGNQIDTFLAVAQRSRGTTFRPAASREALLRRVYLDLIGLAPTPDERAAFLADESADAYARLVDRLLADPRHAERWARHWMDVWR